jgi:hypothetical protein
VSGCEKGNTGDLKRGTNICKGSNLKFIDMCRMGAGNIRDVSNTFPVGLGCVRPFPPALLITRGDASGTLAKLFKAWYHILGQP